MFAFTTNVLGSSEHFWIITSTVSQCLDLVCRRFLIAKTNNNNRTLLRRLRVCVRACVRACCASVLTCVRAYVRTCVCVCECVCV